MTRYPENAEADRPFRPSGRERDRSPAQRHLDDGFQTALSDVIAVFLAHGDRAITADDLPPLARSAPDQEQEPARFRDGYERGLAAFVPDHRLTWAAATGQPGLEAVSVFGGCYTVTITQVGKAPGVKLWVPRQDRAGAPFAVVKDGTEARLVAQAHYSKQIVKPYADAAREARLAAGLPADPPSREAWLEAEVKRLRAMVPMSVDQTEAALASRRARADALLRNVEDFVTLHQISCAESVSQMDSIMVAMPGFVTDLVEIAGYAPDMEDLRAEDLSPQD